jgi:hypothetical protein
MKSFRQSRKWFAWAAVGAGVFLGAASGITYAQTRAAHPLLGGPSGVVRLANGTPLEGIGVQVIAPRTGIRTTVYTNDDGRYEFPKLEAGTYDLYIARPREFKPYKRAAVQINGADRFEDILLQRVVESEYLPPTPEILAQLSGVEWFANLPGTGKEKRALKIC